MPRLPRARAFRVAFTLGWVALAVYAVWLKYPHVWSNESNAGTPPPSPASVVVAASLPPQQLESTAAPAGADPVSSRPGEPFDGADAAATARALQSGGAGALSSYASASRSRTLSANERVHFAWLLNVARRYDEAWQIAATLDDSSRVQLQLRARTAAWAGRLDDAVVLLPRWLAIAPRDAEAWALLADVQRRLGHVSGRTQTLRRLAELRQGDLSIRRELATDLAQSGDTAGSIEQLNLLVRQSPDDTRDVVALGRLYEQSGQFPEAIGAYQTALDRGYADTDTHRRLARLYGWTRQYRRAAAAWERYLELVPDAKETANGEYGLALLKDGRAADALSKLETALSGNEHDPDLWLAAAEAATALGGPERAVFFLRGLGQVRRLTVEETNWLAGQLQAAGDVPGAIDLLRKLLERTTATASIWERIGDLESARRRYDAALDSYTRILGGNAPRSLWIKAARAAAATGDRQRASDAYERALSLRPGDQDLVLEFARHCAATGEPVRALAMYDRYLGLAKSAAGLFLELAHAALAAGRAGTALHWTSAGLADGARDPALLYAHAQALHLGGRPAEAAAVLQELLARSPDRPEWQAWLARTALARGRHLEAYELFAAVLHRPNQASADLWIATGDAALRIGDVTRARQAYEQARAAGAAERDLAERLHALPSTEFAMPLEIMRDSNDVETMRGGGELFVWPAGFGRMTAGWAAGHIRQEGGPTYAERSADLRLDSVFPTPRVRLQGGVGLQQSGSARLMLWHTAARYQWRDAGSVEVEAFRETAWSAPPRPTALRFNRISDITYTGALFHNTGLRAVVGVALDADQAVQAELAFRQYSDRNVSRDLYVQYQRRLSGARRTWVAVQPHLYLEQWDRESAAYFSPDHHVTLGATLRAITDRPRWTADMAVTPQALFSSGREGFGARLSGGVMRRFGRGSAGAHVMWFFDRRYSFDLWHASARVAIPIGK